MFNTLFEDTIRIINKWKPKEEYSNENKYRDDLLDFLRERFSESSNPLGFQERVSVRKEMGVEFVDIAINRNEVGIELKKDLRKKSQTDRLGGQLNGYIKAYNDIIVLLVGETDKNALEYCKDMISDIMERRGFGINREPRIKIIVKGKKAVKGGSKPKKKDNMFGLPELSDFGL